MYDDISLGKTLHRVLSIAEPGVERAETSEARVEAMYSLIVGVSAALADYLDPDGVPGDEPRLRLVPRPAADTIVAPPPSMSVADLAPTVIPPAPRMPLRGV